MKCIKCHSHATGDPYQVDGTIYCPRCVPKLRDTIKNVPSDLEKKDNKMLKLANSILWIIILCVLVVNIVCASIVIFNPYVKSKEGTMTEADYRIEHIENLSNIRQSLLGIDVALHRIAESLEEYVTLQNKKARTWVSDECPIVQNFLCTNFEDCNNSSEEFCTIEEAALWCIDNGWEPAWYNDGSQSYVCPECVNENSGVPVE